MINKQGPFRIGGEVIPPILYYGDVYRATKWYLGCINSPKALEKVAAVTKIDMVVLFVVLPMGDGSSEIYEVTPDNFHELLCLCEETEFFPLIRVADIRHYTLPALPFIL